MRALGVELRPADLSALSAIEHEGQAAANARSTAAEAANRLDAMKSPNQFFDLFG